MRRRRRRPDTPAEVAQLEKDAKKFADACAKNSAELLAAHRHRERRPRHRRPARGPRRRASSTGWARRTARSSARRTPTSSPTRSAAWCSTARSTRRCRTTSSRTARPRASSWRCSTSSRTARSRPTARCRATREAGVDRIQAVPRRPRREPARHRRPEAPAHPGARGQRDPQLSLRAALRLGAAALRPARSRSRATARCCCRCSTRACSAPRTGSTPTTRTPRSSRSAPSTAPTARRTEESARHGGRVGEGVAGLRRVPRLGQHRLRLLAGARRPATRARSPRPAPGRSWSSAPRTTRRRRTRGRRRSPSQLEGGVLLTRVGDGHTAYGMGLALHRRAPIDTYLVTGEPPADGTVCR